MLTALALISAGFALARLASEYANPKPSSNAPAAPKQPVPVVPSGPLPATPSKAQWPASNAPSKPPLTPEEKKSVQDLADKFAALSSLEAAKEKTAAKVAQTGTKAAQGGAAGALAAATKPESTIWKPSTNPSSKQIAQAMFYTKSLEWKPGKIWPDAEAHNIRYRAFSSGGKRNVAIERQGA